MKEIVVVCEPMSTAFNFIEDIWEKGMEPVILEVYIPDGYARKLLDEERKVKYSRINFPIRIIKENPDYSKTLEEIRSLNPLLVLAGGEEGVIIGTRLSEDLGLTGNPYGNIANMTQKSAMHNTLKASGLRYIRGEEVSSYEECLLFMKESETEDVVLKHVHGCASVGVHLIHGREELLDAFKQEKSAENMFGESQTRLMIQERIFGVEYIVNTVSRNGIPALTSVLKYYKKCMPSGAIIYRGEEVITELNKSEKELVDYAFDTVRALGIVNGPVHGEYMVDEKGPVLIEINCRVMGGSIPAGFLDKVFGYHETDVVLESMLDINYHHDFRKKPYRPLRKGYNKDFYCAKTSHISSSGIVPILLNMKSYYSGWVENAGKTEILQETIDLETSTGCVCLVHDDKEIVEKEFEILMTIEEKYPNLIHSDMPLFMPPEDESVITPKIRDILNSDTEVLIRDIIKYYREGANEEFFIPEALVKANSYNMGIMEILKEIS